MMHGWKWVMYLTMLLCWMPSAIAGPEASGVVAASGAVAASGVAPSAEDIAKAETKKALETMTATPEQYFEAAIKAANNDDLVTARKMYLNAAMAGHAEAQARVALLMYEGSDHPLALYFFRKAAEQGNIDGMYGMGLMYLGSDAIERSLAEARKWFVKAAEAGHKMALRSLANACIGLDADARSRLNPKELADQLRDSPLMCGSEELLWIKRAADDDYVPAVKALANAYRAGQYGLEVNPKQADELDIKVKNLLGIKELKKKKTRMR